MPSFTAYLNQAIQAEWQSHYIDYAYFKSLLEKIAMRRQQLDIPGVEFERYYDLDSTALENLANSDSNHDDRTSLADSLRESFRGSFRESFRGSIMVCGSDLSSPLSSKRKRENYLNLLEREEVFHVLDTEILKCGDLYLQEIHKLQQRMDKLVSLRRRNDGNNHETNLITMEYMKLGNDVLQLNAFVGANITTLRQIIIRYDCLIRTLNGPPLGQRYLVQRRNMQTKNERFEAVFSRRQLILLSNRLVAILIQEEENYAREFTNHSSGMELVIQNVEKAVDKSSTEPWSLTDSIVHRLKDSFLMGSGMSELVMAPGFIRTRGAKLKKEIKYFATWRDRSFKPHTSNDSLMSVLGPSHFINFTAQLLYMMNHYIIEPSSTKYIHELGGNDALSGLLIGMAPWAALISAFVYSVWSNRSFREPLLCSSVFLVFGSFVYANALKFNSITLAMVGRFLTGLGAPCGINIRMIADTIPATHRTAVSAMFTTVSALGMSLGPFFAVLLDFLDIDVVVPFYGEVIINGMTGPGYVMFLLWLFYAVALIMFFEDSDRVGLQEIIEKTKTQDSGVYQPPTSLHHNVPNVDSVDSSYTVTSAMSTDIDDILSVDEEKSDNLINEATGVCMGLKFIGKFALEIIGCSVSIITRHRYEWTIKNIGMLSFANGCLVIPISTTVGYLSQYYEDRSLLVGLLGMALVGVLLLIDCADMDPGEVGGYYYYNEGAGYHDDGGWASVGPLRYICGVIFVFCGYQAAQSVILSILSKVVPLALAKGTFNSGFIATSLTTLARANGDVFITLMGLVSIRHLLNLIAIPSLLLTLFSIMIAVFHREQLAV